MSALGNRQAVPGLTSVPGVLGHEERITRLEQQNAELRQMLIAQAEAISTLSLNDLSLQGQITRGTQHDKALQRQIDRIGQTRQGDMRLSEVLDGIEQRLGLVEQGVCR